MYKLGVTSISPWRKQKYEDDGYTFNLVMYSMDPGTMSMLETGMIEIHDGKPGCENIGRGGEGATRKKWHSKRAPFFFYVATRDTHAGWRSIAP